MIDFNEVRKLQRYVLAKDSGVSRKEFFAEPAEEQARYVRWLRSQAADVRRELRHS